MKCPLRPPPLLASGKSRLSAGAKACGHISCRILQLVTMEEMEKAVGLPP